MQRKMLTVDLPDDVDESKLVVVAVPDVFTDGGYSKAVDAIYDIVQRMNFANILEAVFLLSRVGSHLCEQADPEDPKKIFLAIVNKVAVMTWGPQDSPCQSSSDDVSVSLDLPETTTTPKKLLN